MINRRPTHGKIPRVTGGGKHRQRLDYYHLNGVTVTAAILAVTGSHLILPIPVLFVREGFTCGGCRVVCDPGATLTLLFL